MFAARYESSLYILDKSAFLRVKNSESVDVIPVNINRASGC